MTYMASVRHLLRAIHVRDIFCIWLVCMAPMAVYSRRFIAVWVCLMPLALIANSLVRRDWRPQFSAPLAALLAGVVLWQGMTWFWSIHPERSLFVFSVSTLIFVSLALAFGSTCAARDGDDIAVGRVALISALLLAFLIAFERATDLALPKWLWPMLGQRPPVSMAWLGFPMSILALMTWPATAHLLNLGWIWRAGLFVALVFALSLTLVSATNILAMVMGSIVFPFVFRFPRLLPLVLIGVVAAANVLPVLPYGNTARRLATWNLSTNLSSSLQHRLIVWNFSRTRLLDRPFLGWGLGAARHLPGGAEVVRLKIRVGGNTDRSITHSVKQMPLHPHNGMLEIAIETGLVGLVGWLALLIFGLLAALRRIVAPGGHALLSSLAATIVVISSSSFSVWKFEYLAGVGLIVATGVWMGRVRAKRIEDGQRAP